jgi:hypothetical protein
LSESYVFESSHVGALMDIGQARIALDAETRAISGDPAARFGQGYHDFVGGAPLASDAMEAAITVVVSQDPDCWSTVLRAALIVAQGAEGPEDLRNSVKHLAALSVAWLEDIEARASQGV